MRLEASPDAGTTVYVRDLRGLITQMTDARGIVANYTNDNAGQVTSIPVGTVHYIHDLDGHIIAEADASTGATSREYIWMAANDNEPTDLPLAVVDDVTTFPTLLMVHTDHLGRPIRMTDASRATVWQASWKPWGEPQSISGTRALNLRFPGQYFQIETTLAYNWHRHYDPATGRYTQPDPLRFVDGPSVYAYAGNSPFVYVDRDGRFFKEPITAIILTDAGVPDPTDAAWPKWVGYGVAIAAATAIDAGIAACFGGGDDQPPPPNSGDDD